MLCDGKERGISTENQIRKDAEVGSKPVRDTLSRRKQRLIRPCSYETR